MIMVGRGDRARAVPRLPAGAGGAAATRACRWARRCCSSAAATRAADYLYADELRGFEADGIVRVESAFSRAADAPSRYVQDAMLDCADEVWDLLQQDAAVFVCGNASTMAPGVRSALTTIFRDKTGDRRGRRRGLARRPADDRPLRGGHLGRLTASGAPFGDLRYQDRVGVALCARTLHVCHAVQGSRMNDRNRDGRSQHSNQGDIDEALDCMRHTLQRFHSAGDKRAIFLQLYYIMTLEVHAAIHGLGDYRGKQVFLDADWVRALSGKFATLYFKGLDTRGREPDEGVERAWKAADTACRSFRSTVVQNALLGINAHINYDLPRAIAANLNPAELNDYPTLQLREFDHDQVNNLLVRTLRPIQDVLARDYAPGIALIDNLLGNLDEQLSEAGLKYYRERVLSDASPTPRR